MKKTILILVTALLASCALLKDHFYIDMTEAEFKRKNPNISILELTKERTVYRLDQVGNDRDLFVYFVDGKLVRVDEDPNVSNVIIKQNQ